MLIAASDPSSSRSIPSAIQCLLQHFHRADVIRKKKHQACVHRVASIRAQVSVSLDQCLIEVIWRLKVQISFQFHGSAFQQGRANARRMAA